MMSEYGGDFISVTDEDGNEFELELLDAFVHNDIHYHAFIPADADDEEELEIILLKIVEQDGEELLATLDSEEEENAIYDLFMERLDEFEDEA